MAIAARYKVYIIDEVHMLSKNAFNALLKTLEEPPSHVKFIFATTEIRKIPVTILSRCQRFDLKRIDRSMLANHLGNIAAKEDVVVQKEALSLISSSAEGSVRDALSLLDQIIAHADGEITAQLVRDVLGLSDKSKVIELFISLAKGAVEESFGVFNSLYINGGDPVLIFNDLLEFTYLVSRMKAAPNLDPDVSVPQIELESARELAEKLDVSYLTRLWQMLLKGLDEVKIAPDSFAAAEMIMIRVAYMSDLPSPAKILKICKNPAFVPIQSKLSLEKIIRLLHLKVKICNPPNLAYAIRPGTGKPIWKTMEPPNFPKWPEYLKKKGKIGIKTG